MKSILTIASILLSTICYSQYFHNNTFYLRVGLNEPCIGYERKINDVFGLGFEAGYRFRLVEEARVPNIIIGYPFQSFWMAKAYRGLSSRPMVFNFYDGSEKRFGISTLYQYLSANNLIDDKGKFIGSNTAYYAEFSEKRQTIGLSYLYDRQLRHLTALSWFFELGARLSLFERQYTIEGTFANQTPSDKTSSGSDFGIIMNFGFRINLFGY